jgi:RHS repeat-associated protein
LYRGEQYDPDLQLYYLRARYFNPLTGRFLSRDPAAGQPTVPRTQHKYLYVGGNPVNKRDPSGRFESGEYGLLGLKALQSSVGAEAIGCVAGIAGVVTTWVMGLAESGIDAVGVGGGLSLTACGVTFTEEVLKNPFGVYRALPASVMKWSGKLSPILGGSHCVYMLYELFNAMADESEKSEKEIQREVLEEFVQGFECGIFLGMILL